MPIHPLPQFEADVAELEREKLIDSLACRGFDRAELENQDLDDLRRLENRKAPQSLVVRFGATMMVGEFPYKGDISPGCGSKLVVRTHRGVEMGELLTATCPNAGCSSSVTRQQMLEYIEASGGRQYPFSTDGRVLRVATMEDMDAQAKLEQSRHGLKMDARAVAESLRLDMKIVDAEPILGGELLTFYYTSEQRVDFRELVRELGQRHRTRIEMRQVGARDEARLTADYEKCGQYCCCKNFLKVLKPVSMKSAKVQKATLDPVKISGRCGRLMCCLRYEDETYEDLARRLPRRKARVGTPDGDGVVISTQILTQLVLVRLDDSGDDQAYPVEELGKPGERPASSGPARERAPKRPERRPRRPERAAAPAQPEAPAAAPDEPAGEPGPKKKRRRRRRRKPEGEQAGAGDAQTPATPDATPPSADSGGESPDGPPRKRRRRRRRRRGGPEGGGGESGGSGGDE